jgi:hypothetical protein
MGEAAVDALLCGGETVAEFRNAAVGRAVVRFDGIDALVRATGMFGDPREIGSGVSQFAGDNGIALVHFARVLLPCVRALIQMREAAIHALLRGREIVAEFRDAPVGSTVVRFDSIDALVGAPGMFIEPVCALVKCGGALVQTSHAAAGFLEFPSDNSITLVDFAAVLLSRVGALIEMAKMSVDPLLAG